MELLLLRTSAQKTGHQFQDIISDRLFRVQLRDQLLHDFDVVCVRFVFFVIDACRQSDAILGPTVSELHFFQIVDAILEAYQILIGIELILEPFDVEEFVGLLHDVRFEVAIEQSRADLVSDRATIFHGFLLFFWCCSNPQGIVSRYYRKLFVQFVGNLYEETVSIFGPVPPVTSKLDP